MKQTVYADILFIVNLYVNFILLLITAKFLHKAVYKIRLALASVLGAFYSFTVFLDLPAWAAVLLQLCVISAVMLIFCKITSFFDFIKSVLCFYLFNIIFAGGMYALWTWLRPRNMFVKNSVVYFDISPMLLIISTLVIYVFLAAVNRITQGKRQDSHYADISFELFGQHITMKGYYDSGNTLQDVFTNTPVVVCSFAAIKPYLPRKLADLLEEYFRAGGFEGECDNEYMAKIRLIPCETIHRGGLLPSVKPANFTIIKNGKPHEIPHVLLGITNRSVANGNYEVLLHADMTENIAFSR